MSFPHLAGGTLTKKVCGIVELTFVVADKEVKERGMRLTSTDERQMANRYEA